MKKYNKNVLFHVAFVDHVLVKFLKISISKYFDVFLGEFDLAEFERQIDIGGLVELQEAEKPIIVYPISLTV